MHIHRTWLTQIDGGVNNQDILTSFQMDADHT